MEDKIGDRASDKRNFRKLNRHIRTYYALYT